jgi:hypothetical protein
MGRGPDEPVFALTPLPGFVDQLERKLGEDLSGDGQIGLPAAGR